MFLCKFIKIMFCEVFTAFLISSYNKQEVKQNQPQLTVDKNNENQQMRWKVGEVVLGTLATRARFTEQT